MLWMKEKGRRQWKALLAKIFSKLKEIKRVMEGERNAVAEGRDGGRWKIR